MAKRWRDRYRAGMSRLVVLALCVALLAAADLVPPGWPVAIARPDLAPPGWARADGELRALAADGAVRWRRPLDPGAQLWPGLGGTLLADGRGLRWLDADCGERPLPPLPSDVLPLGVDGAVAFFAQDRVGWRLDDAPVRISLPGEPLGVPLASGRTSLWLTQQRLVWSDGLRTVAHRHGLAAGRGWGLARDRSGAPLVLAPDGRAWAIPAQVPGQDDERLGLPVPPAAQADRETRIRLALARGDWPAARRDAIGRAEQAAVAMYAGDPPPSGSDDLAPLPRDPGELSLSEPAWSGGVAPRARAYPRPVVPAARLRDRPLRDDPQPCPAEDRAAQRLRDGLVVGQRAWSVEDDGERTTALCRDDGRVRWFTRWLSEPLLGAPGRSLILVDGRLLIADGDARLLVLEAGTGAIELDVRPRRLPLLPGRTWPVRDGVVVLFPPGRDDRLGRIHGDGREDEVFLPAPARWILVLPDGEVWLGLNDGRTVAGDGSGLWRELILPAELVAAGSLRLVDGGVASGQRYWPWRQE